MTKSSNVSVGFRSAAEIDRYVAHILQLSNQSTSSEKDKVGHVTLLEL
jgi:hypothetical protein